LSSAQLWLAKPIRCVLIFPIFIFDIDILKKKIGIPGPNAPLCSAELYGFGVELGRETAAPDRVIIFGGDEGQV
jgi:hypothetical protein